MFSSHLFKATRMPIIHAKFFSSMAAAQTGQMHQHHVDVRKQEIQKLLENYKLKVGFEFHCQVKSKHKLFSSKCCVSFLKRINFGY